MADEGTTHQVDLKTWKVKENKILQANEKNKFSTSLYDEFFVCIESDALTKISGSLMYSKFKNVVGVFIKTENIEETMINEIVSNLDFKCRNHPEFFFQIFIKSSKSTKIYLKTKKAEKFEEFSASKEVEEFKKWSENNEKTFNVENLCTVLIHKNLSLDELTFDDIFNLYKLKKDNENVLKFLSFIDDDFLKKMLWGFDIKLPNHLFSDVIAKNDLKTLHCALKCMHFLEFNEKLVEILLNNEHCEEFLMPIAQKNDLNLLNGLLKYSKLIENFINFHIWNKVRKFSLENHSFDVHFELQRLESCYYQQFDKINSKNTLKAIEMLHKDIEAKNLNEIKTFMKDYPDFKFCFDSNEVCALEKSIDCKSFEIYAYLRSEDFIPYKKDVFDLKLKDLKPEEFEVINKFNLQNVKSHDDDFIHILYSKCDLFSCHGEFSSTEIWEMHKILAKFEGVHWIMKNASKSEIQIVFDLRTVGINVIDHTQGEKCYGISFNDTKKLYVGRNFNKLERFGTFAHELAHLVIFLVYENDSHPYCEHDLERKAKWEAIVEKYLNFHEDPLNSARFNKYISRVFTYRPHKHGIELVVKVPELLAYFYENPAKINEVREKYPEVFDYFYECLLPDLQIPFVIEMNKLNQDFELFKEIESSVLQIEPSKDNKILKLSKETLSRILLTSNVSQLLLSQIVHELKNESGNKLNLKARNIYLDIQKLDQEHIRKEFEELLAKVKVERVIVKITSFENIENLIFVDNLKPKTSCFLVSFDNSRSNTHFESFKFSEHTLNFLWSDLTQKSRNFLLQKNVKFQSGNVEVSKLLENHKVSISSEILSDLCSNDELQVNLYSKPIELENYISRSIKIKEEASRGSHHRRSLSYYLKRQKIIKNQYLDDQNSDFPAKDYELDDYLEKIVKNMNIVLISDMAGSGKTTFLKKVTETLTSKFPSHWISFISLKEHIKILDAGVNEPFVDFVAKILKLNAFSKAVFKQKYSQGKAKILFDGFDEISPFCKDNSLKLLQSFEKFGENQMFITTRTHLAHELENKLETPSHNLKVLEDHEQVDILKQIWITPDSDSIFIDQCANSLVIKIAEVILTSSSFIGLPLIVSGLAEVFKNKINENFEAEIKNLDITDVYKRIIEKSLEVLHAKFPEKSEENLKKLKGLLQAHVYFSIELVFGDGSANEMGLTHDSDEWSMEEIARGGIFKYDSDGKPKLNHSTYADYFIGGYAFDFIKNSRKPSTSQLEVLLKILSEERFQITRMFLDNRLEKVETFTTLLILNSSEKFCDSFNGKLGCEAIELIAKEDLLNLFSLIIELVKKCNPANPKHIFEYDLEGKTILMDMLPTARNLRCFEKVLALIFDFYSKKIFDKFLMRTDDLGNSIFHHFAMHCYNSKIIEAFWSKIEGKNLTTEQTEQIFYHKNKINQTFYLTAFIFHINDMKSSVVYKELSKRKERNAILHKIITEKLSEEKIIEMMSRVDSNNDGCLAIFFYDFSIEIAMKLLFCMSPNMELLTPSFLRNILSFMSPKNFIYFCSKLEEKSIDVKKVLMQKPNGGALTMTASNPGIFQLVFEKARNFCESENEFEDLIFGEDSEFLLAASLNIGEISNIKFLLDKIVEILGIERIKFLLTQNEFRIVSFLIIFTCMNPNQSNMEVFNLMWAFFQVVFHGEKEFMSDKGLCRRILKYKNDRGMSVLQISIAQKSEKTFFYLFKTIYCEIFEIKKIIDEVDHKGENVFHYLARYGSLKMLEEVTAQLTAQLSSDEIINLVKLTNNDGKNILQLTEENTESVKCFIFDLLEKVLTDEDFKNLLKEVIRDLSQNFIEVLKKRGNEDKLEKIWEITVEGLTSFECQLFLMLKDKDGMNVFHYFAKKLMSSEIFESIFVKIKKLFNDQMMLKALLLLKDDDAEMNALLRSIFSKNENAFLFLFEKAYCEIFEFEQFIYEVDDEGENFFHNLVRHGTTLMIETATDKLIDHFLSEDLEEFLSLRNVYDDNILHMTAAKDDSDTSTLNFIINFLESNMAKEKLKEFLSAKGQFSRFPLHVVFVHNTFKAAKIFVNFYKKHFKREEICAFCWLKEEESNKNIFEIASERSDKFFDVISSYLG